MRVPAQVVCLQWGVFLDKSACDTRTDNSNLLGSGPGGGNVDDGGNDGVVVLVVMVVVVV